jgi:hypothetical protein
VQLSMPYKLLGHGIVKYDTTEYVRDDRGWLKSEKFEVRFASDPRIGQARK